ncbi:MAG: ATP-binding protein [Bacteroidales bacterium]|nr:ATP-binding protein [Bacteroidales bacterium]
METKEIIYPIGIQTFSEIRKGHYLYVDKTAYVYQLVKTGKYYFLSRPRRFGKSLLLSTIESYFLGQKDLFEGLALYELEKDWKEYPVLHFDFNSGQYDGPEGVYAMLSDQLDAYERQYGAVPGSMQLGNRFGRLIRQVHEQTGRQVVLLFDEYDKPLLETINDRPLQEKYRRELKPFYGCVKTYDRYIQFAFFTGVTKIGKLSVFSDLNNLEDISMVDEYAQICGVTRREIETDMAEPVRRLAQKYGISDEEMHLRLKKEYDGYRFTREDAKVYNPYSLLCCFKQQRIDRYWFQTGTPSYLAHLLHRHHFSLWDLDGITRKASQISSVSSFTSDPIPVIYQSGYLTIKEYNPTFEKFKLGFPNTEVREGFIDSLLPYYIGEKGAESFDVEALLNAINTGNVNGFIEELQSLFADIPYIDAKDFSYEGEFRNVLYIIFSILGFYAQVEKQINTGRIDLVVKTVTTVYVMEFKLDGSADEALAQIDSRDYSIPYRASGKKIVKVGISFSHAHRNISDWKIQTM